MNFLRNSVANLVVIVRGSVAAEHLRELLEKSEKFDAVSVVSAFPSSIEKLVEDLVIDKPKTETLGLSVSDPEATQVNLLDVRMSFFVRNRREYFLAIAYPLSQSKPLVG